MYVYGHVVLYWCVCVCVCVASSRCSKVSKMQRNYKKYSSDDAYKEINEKHGNKKKKERKEQRPIVSNVVPFQRKRIEQTGWLRQSSTASPTQKEALAADLLQLLYSKALVVVERYYPSVATRKWLMRIRKHASYWPSGRRSIACGNGKKWWHYA